MAIKTDTLAIKFVTDNDGNVTASLGNVERSLQGVQRSADGTAGGMRGLSVASTAAGVAMAAAGVSLLAAIRGATTAIVEYEKLNAQLITIAGSQERANQVMAMARRAAEETGGAANELAAAWIRLEQGGLKPTAQTLVAVANVAAATGVELGRVVEATTDAANGQAMALRALRMSVSEDGDKITVSFGNLRETIDNDTASIARFIERVGLTELAGAAKRDSDSLAGAWGDLKKAAGELVTTLTVDTGLVSVLTELLRIFTALVGAIPNAKRELEEFADQAQTAGSAVGAWFNAVRSGPMIAAPFAGMQAVQLRQDSAAPETERQAQAARELSKETKELVARLLEQAATYGKLRSEVLEYEKAQALAKASTDEERAALAAAYDAAIDAASGVERATAAERALSDAKQEASRLDRERERAERERRRQLEEATRQQEEYLAAVQDVVDEMLPLDAAVRRNAEAQQLLNVALVKNPEAAERLMLALHELKEEAEDLRWDRILGGDDAEPGDAERAIAAARRHAREVMEAYRRELDDLSGALTDAILVGAEEGFHGMGEVLARWAQSQSAGALQDLIRNLLVDVFGMSDGTGSIQNVPGTGGGVQDYVPDSGTQRDSMISVDNAIAIAGGLYQIYSQSQGMGAGEAAVSGAITGAASMAQTGNPYAIVIGAIVGAIAGYFSAGDSGPPEIDVRGGNAAFGPNDGRARSPFGNVFVREQNTSGSGTDYARQVSAFDANLARLLTPEQLERVAAAMATAQQHAGSLEEIISQRLNVALQAAVPEWAGFLQQFSDVEERLRQFGALRAISDMLVELDEAAAEFNTDPIAQTTARFAALRRSMDEAFGALANAIDVQDPVQIEDAARQAQAAVQEWARATIEAVTTLEAALDRLNAESRAFEVSMAQRIAAVTGGALTDVITILTRQLGGLRAQVASGRTPEQSLGYLNEFISTVDAWLQQSTAEVNRLLQEQLAALALEREEILGSAAQRQAAAQAAQQAAAAAEQAAVNALRDALQEALQLAQEWQSVLEQTEQMIDQLRFSSANPLGPQTRLALLEQEASGLYGQLATATGQNRVDIANRLLEILQEQLSLQTELFQRPSDDAVEAYNAMLARLNELRAIAQPEADRAIELQEQLNALQQGTTDAVNTLGDTLSFLSEAERDRLDQIAAEEEAARAEAQRRIDEINSQAAEYYTWARDEGRRLQEEQRQLLQDQLNALTGGLTVEMFLAQVNQQARDYLFDIRNDIRAFLESIGTVGNLIDQIGQPPGSGFAPPTPVVPGDPNTAAAGGVHIHLDGMQLVAPAGSDPQAFAAQFTQHLERNLPGLATRLKPLLTHA